MYLLLLKLNAKRVYLIIHDIWLYIFINMGSGGGASEDPRGWRWGQSIGQWLGDGLRFILVAMQQGFALIGHGWSPGDGKCSGYTPPH